jgi:hypothetical protein
MLRFLLCLLCSALLLASSPRAEGQHPAMLTIDGAAPLPLAAQARRAHLLGTVDLYTLALYLDGPLRDDAQLISRHVPKALRIEVTVEDDWRHRVAIDWRDELVPRLEAAATAHLRGSFAPLRPGDVVLIEYAPDKGTTVRVNKAVAVSGANHDLMLAFLDRWLGQRPVSEEIRRTLLG